ncbi:MAG: YfhO family protein [Deltaproteobacteria bacterium]|nr:YfhO family protein [Deltaproteobacteria bacterium]
MTERRKTLLALGVLLGVLILFFGKILFTDKIIRAPDIINEYYWSVVSLSKQSLGDVFRLHLSADWDIFNNTGNTLEGGGQGNRFLFWQGLLYKLIPPPASVAWFIVLHLFAAAAGVFMLCRAIGCGRLAAVAAGLVFALAPENASLINAGHVLKIATICVAPWAFYFLERGLQSRRPLFFMTAGFVLALQFFYTHWQIAFYTCLAVALYALTRSAAIIMAERQERPRLAGRLFLLNLVVLVFFLTTVAMDLMPLAKWSSETNRGALSGANQGKGGLNREEAMLWSMPPEELAAFAIPGMFGFSRQEGGENPTNIGAYYWGRMIFTQTTSYLGLLPWLLLPLPLLFRRDRYTWIALAGVVLGLLFSMGKFTPFYNLLFDHFPGVNRFRVPKMIMFIPVLAMAFLSGIGLTLLRDEAVRTARRFRGYLLAVAALPLLLLLLLAVEKAGEAFWITSLMELLAQPTRYQQGAQLVAQRWNNLVAETAIAAAFAAAYALVLWVGCRRPRLATAVPLLLVLLFLADVGRVNAKFLFLVDEPRETSHAFTTPAIEFLRTKPHEYRVLPMNGTSGPYSAKRIPVLFVPMPVQQQRWQEFLDALVLTSAMPDIVNLKYLVMSGEQYQREKGSIGDRYVPVFQAPDGSEVVLENRRVLPKGWLVPSVALASRPGEALTLMQNSAFDPRRLAIVEVAPPFAMSPPDRAAGGAGEVVLGRYEGLRIDLTARATVNALLVLGEKYYQGWKATVDGRPAEIQRVNHILRGVYLTPGEHRVEFVFDPLPFKIGKYLTLASFALFAALLVREWLLRRGRVRSEE